MDMADNTTSSHIEVVLSFRIFADHVEVDVLKAGPQNATATGLDALTSLLQAAAPFQGNGQWPASPVAGAVSPGREPATESFAEWLTGILRREGLTLEAAARQLGVSVKTVSRWVGGATEPRLRDLRRIHELFGEIPFT
jgi:hypothetical protein